MSSPSNVVVRVFVRALVALLRSLSLGSVRSLARSAGSLAFALGVRRHVALDNLKAAYPEQTEAWRRSIARAAFQNMALAFAEGLIAPKLSRAQLDEAVIIENWGALAAVLAAKKGALIATAHFGSWELFGEVMARRQVPLAAVVKPLRGSLNAELVASRRESGLQLIAARGSVMAASRAVREGKVVALLMDQSVPSGRGVFVPFFGRPASTTPALSLAALRSKAPVFAALAMRDGERLRVVIEGPFPVPETGDRERDIAQHTATVTQALETIIRRAPEQWLWLHRRWKERPPES